MKVAISLERYLGLCHPMLPLHTRKAWFYVLPVVAMSFALNAPKFLEIQLKFDNVNGTVYPTLDSTELRFDETYIRWVENCQLGWRGSHTYSLRIFRVYIMWTRLFTTAVIPVALLLYFNSRIFIDLLNSKV